MKVKELKSAITDIQLIFEEAGAKSAAADFAELTMVFDGHENDDVEEFLSELRALYVKDELPRSGVVNDLAAKRYVNRLNDAAGDAEQFAAVLQELASDRAVRKTEMNIIQKAYIGGRDTWPTRKEALNAIQKTFDRRQYTRAALRSVEKATPW